MFFSTEKSKLSILLNLLHVFYKFFFKFYLYFWKGCFFKIITIKIRALEKSLTHSCLTDCINQGFPTLFWSRTAFIILFKLGTTIIINLIFSVTYKNSNFWIIEVAPFIFVSYDINLIRALTALFLDRSEVLYIFYLLQTTSGTATTCWSTNINTHTATTKITTKNKT